MSWDKIAEIEEKRKQIRKALYVVKDGEAKKNLLDEWDRLAEEEVNLPGMDWLHMTPDKTDPYYPEKCRREMKRERLFIILYIAFGIAFFIVAYLLYKLGLLR